MRSASGAKAILRSPEAPLLERSSRPMLGTVHYTEARPRKSQPSSANVVDEIPG